MSLTPLVFNGHLVITGPAVDFFRKEKKNTDVITRLNCPFAPR